MPDYEQRLLILTQRIDGRWSMSRMALSPEYSVLSADVDKGRELLTRRAKETIESLPVAELYGRRWGWNYDLRHSEVTIAPTIITTLPNAPWRPFTLRFDWIAWSPSADAHVAYVPALDLHVLQSRAEKRAAAVEREILAAIERRGGQNPLALLAQADRQSGLEVGQSHITVDLPTPKQAALRALEREGEEASVLKQSPRFVATALPLPFGGGQRPR